MRSGVTDERRDLVSAAPGERDPGTAVAVAVHDAAAGRLPGEGPGLLEAYDGARRSEPDPVPQDPRTAELGDQVGGPPEQLLGDRGVGPAVPRAVLLGAPDDDVAAARDDVGGAGVVEPPAVEADLFDVQHLSPDRHDRRVAGQQPRAQAATRSGGCAR